MRIVFLLGLAIAASGCAQSSGALRMGPDTYSLSVHAAPLRGGQSGARKIALEEAQAKCASDGKELLVTNLNSGRSTHLPGGTVEVTFQCLAKGDSGLTRPTYQQAPSVVIEDRRQ